MSLLFDLIRCRQLLMEAGMGRVGATINAPIFYVVGYMHAESIARKTNQSETHDRTDVD